MSLPLWQFWIDVGGTFTDCLARTGSGQILRHKLLSSGVTKGSVSARSTATDIVDPLRANDPPGFWAGAAIRLLDDAGQVQQEATVAGFESGALRVDRAISLTVGQTYELATGEEAPIIAVRYLMGLALDQPIAPLSMRLGTTRGTNALLTRRGASTALVTTRGFGDILRIGYQNRPRLFDLQIRKPAALFEAVVEIDERMDADGNVLKAADEQQIRRQFDQLRQTGIQSLGICLLNSYTNGRHEQLVADIAREAGFHEISVSSQIVPLIKLVSRGDTTVADAYLNPVLREYVATLRADLEKEGGKESSREGENPETQSGPRAPAAAQLRILTSAGGLVDADEFVGKDSILSGPAGGVVGFSAVARAAGFERAIGFDMGGTSTDVSRFDGRYDRQYETEKAGVRIVAPMMAIETVAAGGGSICHFDGVKLAVGPDSAGANPGPACYGRGGPLSVTDMNLLLGKILPEHFPFRLDRTAAEAKLAALCREIANTTQTHYSPTQLADGFVRVANANMAKAIRSVSVAKGCDPRDYVLVAFGGAAGQHACALARELGIRQILNHPDAGILSAYGIGMAHVERHRVEGVYRQFDDAAMEQLQAVIDRLRNSATDELRAEGIDDALIETNVSLDLRYQGLDAFLTIPQPGDGNWQTAYETEHEKLYGYKHEGRPLEIVAVRAEAIGRSAQRPPAAQRIEPKTMPDAAGLTTTYFDAQAIKTNVFHRDQLQPGDIVFGPAIVLEKVATTVIDPGWSAEVLSDGQLLITFEEESETARGRESETEKGTPSIAPDPILLEIFNNQFAGIAEQMGITLRNTSSSVNVKERLDFSCAIFTPQAELVVNAPHIPVHLGAMGMTVQRIISDNPDLQPGDVLVTNDPYRGGSHLPDITVVTPVHDETGRLLFFTASRAHHAEIGGVRAGSMPPFSTHLAEEGVLIRNFKVVDRGRSRMEEFRQLLLSAPYPTRNVADNLADVSAQIAANRQGARDLLRLIETQTLPVVSAYMKHIQAAAEQKMRRALSRLGRVWAADSGGGSSSGKVNSHTRTFIDHLDDGSPIQVAITIRGDAATIDFSGTGPVLPGNLNANRAIVTAAVMYVLRCLIDEDIPLNQGVLAPVEIVLPESLLNPPERDRADLCAAVAGGNVETSQRVVDVLLGALGAAAASQGTMNNLLFGDATFGYYETIGGGAGATAGGDGPDAVHTHMTNTRLTDPEVIEQRYPVRVREFAIRRGSGGRGKQRGGDGIVRRIEFLKQLDVSILSQRRGQYPPYGLSGGKPAAIGRNTLTRADGTVEHLAGLVQFTAMPGDILTIETPGGGGFGIPE